MSIQSQSTKNSQTSNKSVGSSYNGSIPKSIKQRFVQEGSIKGQQSQTITVNKLSSKNSGIISLKIQVIMQNQSQQSNSQDCQKQDIQDINKQRNNRFSQIYQKINEEDQRKIKSLDPKHRNITITILEKLEIIVEKSNGRLCKYPTKNQKFRNSHPFFKYLTQSIQINIGTVQFYQKYYVTIRIDQSGYLYCLNHENIKIKIKQFLILDFSQVQVLNLTASNINNVQFDLLCENDEQNRENMKNIKIIILKLNQISKVTKTQLQVFQSLQEIDFGEEENQTNKLNEESKKQIKQYQKQNQNVRVKYMKN